MKFGVSFLPDASPRTKSPQDYFRDAIDLSARAEENGFAYCKMTEHYLNQYGGYCPSPLQFLAAVAERTRSMRLITGCIIPSLHHPVELAATTAMLDAISGGRLDVGVARGYMPYEFDTFGIELGTSRDRYAEAIDLMQQLWSGAEVSGTSEFFPLRSARSWPLPVQQPHPPLWGAAVRSRQSFAWLGERGFGLLVTSGFADLEALATHVSIYRSTAQASGHEPRVLMSIPLMVRQTDKQADVEGRAALQEYLDVWAGAADSWAGVASQAYKGYTGMSRGIRAAGVDGLLGTGGAIIGSATTCAAEINKLTARITPDGYLWQLDTGSASRASMFETLDRFCSDVEPLLG
ncbi:LLM class flavin-dependent oxidoreductase [Microbacterium trichothecenolyticum]|uniref:Alkanesulfonate monooxygenase SsuD/methylene tetrahydromethanopterin reductase-like flavin-dependent oxidoreductase (Luciferase family) n=1 Tax=Microbacterium trichothecenolyticum TaxID=69370 RepID=A0ABU0TSK8_MICTR|nr:LLM class flavin-dependent oxidoreductase [Microbacterium trichothecenolyticum]MDQ1122641.1 alkanesulfonate monooxygenase SsuD/methylene tetrahydromethanopterin reductase-like flavin-dependent oxidoreductase (luciferase family) [Microbacterium trichothecenolyticum]